MLQESYRVAGNNNLYLPYDYLKYKTTLKSVVVNHIW